MEPEKAKSLDLDRRRSVRSALRVSVHEDRPGPGHDAAAAAMVADGFRPSRAPSPPPPSSPTAGSDTALSSMSSSSSSSSSPTRRGSDDSHARSSPPARPSSIAKPSRTSDAASLPYEGAGAGGMGSILETSSTRSSDRTSDSGTYVGSESPYRGPSNPSHPYQMYPQGVRMARTLSTTTTSTTVPLSESSYTGPRGPAHPYSIYPQNTLGEAALVSPPPAAIPVGFPGMPDRYQRRIGPDGEDLADMIGPDGHTEQLPPYTRYPDEPYLAKDVAAAAAAAGAVVVGLGVGSDGAAAGAPPQGLTFERSHDDALPRPRAIPGAGGLGLATRNPEFESLDDLDSPRSRHSSRSFTSDNSQHRINTAAAAVVSEKARRRPGAARAWGRRRFAGIVPYWAICMTAVALVVMGTVLGSVIGIVLSRHPGPRRGPHTTPASGSPTGSATYDAAPIPTPTDLPELATGTFGMPLMSNRISSTCFNNSQLSQAWSCNIVPFLGLTMTVDRNTETPEDGDYTIRMTCNESLTIDHHFYPYGEQPPTIPNPLPLQLVNDLFQPARGPAWFRMLPYNKTLIVPESLLQAPPPPSTAPSSSKPGYTTTSPTSHTDGSAVTARSTPATASPAYARRNFRFGLGLDRRKVVAEPGDRPWICTWPETYLEIFIFPLQNSSWNRPSATADASSSTTADPYATAAPSKIALNAFEGNAPYPPPTPPVEPPYYYSSSSTDADESAPTPPPAPASSSSSSSSASTTTPASSAATPPAATTPSSSYPPPFPSGSFPPPPPAYPKVVKLEERRVQGSPMPVCRQVEIQPDGRPAVPVKDADGNDVVLYIVENEPDPADEEQVDGSTTTPRWRRRGWEESDVLRRDSGADLSDCGCMWFIT